MTERGKAKGTIVQTGCPGHDFRFPAIWKGGDPMSRVAAPVAATLFALASLLTAGIANADCSTSHSASAPQTPAPTTSTSPTTSG